MFLVVTAACFLGGTALDDREDVCALQGLWLGSSIAEANRSSSVGSSKS